MAPLFYLTVTAEMEGGKNSLHLHPGGQGFWIARMLHSLGCSASIVAPTGGEVGEVLSALVPGWKIGLERVDIAASSPAYVHDRRSGERHELVSVSAPTLDRHDVDDYYAAVLRVALSSDGCVMTASNPPLLPEDAYGRLVADLSAQGVPMFADIHGGALDSTLRGGRLAALKVSDEDLAEDGWNVDAPDAAAAAARELADRGCDIVILSRGSEPALAVVGDRLVEVIPPQLSEVDHRGAGDSMTGGLVAGCLMGMDPLDAIRMGAAAGAGNVTRHGLGSGDPRLIRTLSELVEIRDL
jgi:1-phosphofructokinase